MWTRKRTRRYLFFNEYMRVSTIPFTYNQISLLSVIWMIILHARIKALEQVIEEELSCAIDFKS
jgi:hypothetical protein